jgi:hypothetical protein
MPRSGGKPLRLVMTASGATYNPEMSRSVKCVHL